MNNILRKECAGAAVSTHTQTVLGIGTDDETFMAAYRARCEHEEAGAGADELKENLGDLLCDLRHWATAMGLDFDTCNRTGLMHYKAETAHED